MQILNIAGYKFIPLPERASLSAVLFNECDKLALKGTILLSEEGINLSIAGPISQVETFRSFLKQDNRFTDMTFRESYSETCPFRHLKVKEKKEIITLRQPDVTPEKTRGDAITPELFKQWLDEKRDMTVLDTRNDYEVRFGTFDKAVNLHIDHFSEFPEAVNNLNRDKPVVMFCTGGIRCEKASLYMLSKGFSDVYQLEGGILNYFAKVGGAHFDGECFVFDERVAVNANLEKTNTIQCIACQGPIPASEQTFSHAACAHCART